MDDVENDPALGKNDQDNILINVGGKLYNFDYAIIKTISYGKSHS